MRKKCPKCTERSCKKNGVRNKKQRYRCVKCGHSFWWKTNKNSKNEEMYNLYCFKNRTYEQLSKQYYISMKTVQKRLDSCILKKETPKVHRICSDGYDVYMRAMMTNAI